MANETDHDNEHLLAAAKEVGGQAALARKLDVVPVTVNQWAKNKRPIPDDKVVAIELHTNGKITVDQLAPDRRWVRVADAAWPHPQGRPLIDVAPANEPKEAKAA